MVSRLPDDGSGFTAKEIQQPFSAEYVEDCQASNSRGESKIEPIAVTGFALKYPQEAISAETFWQMLIEGRDATTEFPTDRLNIDAFYDPDISKHNTLPLRGGNFLEEDISLFDAPFFSITPEEAACLDPQQRGMLEVSYRALENAGVSLARCNKSKCSVYTGTFTDDYRSIMFQDPETEHRYAATGLSMSMVANRVSWFFNLKGPSMNLDSACSSSLTALHLACQDLRTREASMGLVGGCNLFYHPDIMMMMSNMNMLSPDSRSWSFDSRANGYARGEGFGVVIIKLLKDALADGDTIRAVIQSTGLNQDGRTPGITVPNGESQRKLILETYAKASLDRGPTRYFEAHGTGTPVGDPIEANSISEVFRDFRTPDDPLYVGAVKSNIGHLEGGSGLAGLIKTIMILEKGIIPPNAGLEEVNAAINPKELCLHFPTHPIAWPCLGVRRACINSFGFGGSNAVIVVDDAFHAIKAQGYPGLHRTEEIPPILEEFKATKIANPKASTYSTLADPEPSAIPRGRPRLLVWSAADEKGIERLSALYRLYFHRKNPSFSLRILDDLIYTLAARRTIFSWRAYLVIDDPESTHLGQMNLDCLKATRANQSRQVAFVFTGQGAQYARMGEELFKYPYFKDSLIDSETELYKLGCRWSLTRELLQREPNSKVDDPEYSQPLCTALQIALVDLLRAIGIKPAAVVGHSSGEIAAAYCTGAISRAAALKIAFYRGTLTTKLVRSQTSGQTMMSVNLSRDEVEVYLSTLGKRYGKREVDIGCINSPSNVTLTGDKTQLTWLQSLFVEESVSSRILRVNVAYHSPFMEEIAFDYLESLGCLEKGQALFDLVPMISSVTGTETTSQELSQAGYWVQNMVSPVQFSQALSQLCIRTCKKQRKQLGPVKRRSVDITDILEIGSHPALRGPIRNILATGKAVNVAIDYVPTLLRESSAAVSILNVVGRLWSLGHPVNLLAANLVSETPRTLMTDLPYYPFEHSQSHWIESRISSGYRHRQFARHDLLGTPNPDWNPFEPQWRNVISLNNSPWIGDHKFNGSCLYPAAGMLLMAIEGVKHTRNKSSKINGYHIRNTFFSNALQIVPNSKGIETRFSLSRTRTTANDQGPWYGFQLLMYRENAWIECCHGEVKLEHVPTDEIFSDDSNTRRIIKHHERRLSATYRACKELNSMEFYELLRRSGADYGPSFQLLDKVLFDAKGHVKADLQSCEWRPQTDIHRPSPHMLHPATLDALFQLPPPALHEGSSEVLPTLVPTYLRNFWVSSEMIDYGEEGSYSASAKSNFNGYRGTESSIIALHLGKHEPRVVIEGYQTTFVTSAQKPANPLTHIRQLCCAMDWKPDIDLMTDEQISQYCERSKPQEEPPVQFYRDLSLAVRLFITETLESLKNMPCKLEPHLIHFVRWMERQVELATVGDFPTDQTDWPKLANDKQLQQIVIHRVKHHNEEGKMFMTMGQNLMPILRGQIDPLDILFKDDLAGAYYEATFSNPHASGPLKSYLDLLVHKNPSMKFLEIGAGTGGATVSCLDSLWNGNFLRCEQYDYTDISPGFFSKAEAKFARYTSRMNFRALNVDLDPVAQGFQDSTYDVIIAANVLHATKSLEVTLRYVRKLLRSGGKLILFEVTRPNIMRSGFVFGLLKDWWAAVEPQAVDQLTPCLSETAWADSLDRNGFSGIDVLIPQYRNAECHEASLLISSALSAPTEPLQTPGIVIIILKDSKTQQQIAALLQLAIVHEFETECSIFSLGEFASLHLAAVPFLVFLVEMDTPLLSTVTAETFSQIHQVLLSAKSLLWVTLNSQDREQASLFHMVDGLSRSLSSENPQLGFTRLALEARPAYNSESLRPILNILHWTNKARIEQLEPEYEERDRMICINRLIQAEEMNQALATKTVSHRVEVKCLHEMPSLELRISTPGSLETLEYQEYSTSFVPLEADEVLIEVKAFGIDFRDFQTATGQLNTKDLGTECSGVIRNAGINSRFAVGDRVNACGQSMARTHVRCKALCVHKIPDWMPFTDAAAVPISGLSAFHATMNIAKLTRGESILIQDAAGGLGQMAIQISKCIGARVFATTSSTESKERLKEMYDIPEDHIFSSKSATYVQAIKDLTSGLGVDVILSSHSGVIDMMSLECVAPFGRLVELGSETHALNLGLPLTPSTKNVIFATVNLPEIICERPAFIGKLFVGINSMIGEGDLRPPASVQVFQASEIKQAFAFFLEGENSRKRVVELAPDCQISATVNTKPTYTFDSQATYVIAGGLGGLGRSIARWMASRGVQHMILLSRYGVKSEVGKTLVEELSVAGVHVEAPACDITQLDVLSHVMTDCATRMPRIRGCVQGTMVLRDTLFENMTFDDFATSTRPKVQGSWYLHQVLPAGLDFFILLSSISGILGAPGQANYCAGNTSQDALAHHRIEHGEKAVSVDLGMVVSEGVVAETDGLLDSLKRKGWYMEISQNELLALLDYYCDPSLDILTPLTCQVIVGIEQFSVIKQKGLDVPQWMSRPLFRHFHQMGPAVSPVSNMDISAGNDVAPHYADILRQTPSLEDAAPKIAEWLTKKIARIVGIAVEDVDPSKPLQAYGLDSLVAIEIRNWLGQEVGAEVTVFDILGKGSMVELCKVAAENSKYVKARNTAKM